MKVALLFFLTAMLSAQGQSWKRHTIDAFHQERGKVGADGVRVADVNGDGRPDLTTGWEQGGAVRIAFHPGFADVQQPWPAVTVGTVPGVEDAAFADLDGDDSIDVISCAEGKVNSVFVHWGPSPTDYARAAAWTTKAFPASAKRRWMFALPMDVNQDGKLDIVIGSKKSNAMVGWLEQPEEARNLKAWRLHEMCPAGWIMSLRNLDVDGDGDEDVILSDRYEKGQGIFWLENPGSENPSKLRQPWPRHMIGGEGRQVMFLTTGDLNLDGKSDVVCATLEGDLLLFLRAESGWKESVIPLPFGLTAGKGVGIADIDGDGRPDLVTTSEAQREKADMVSVAWLRQRENGTWMEHRISDEKGRKFDRIEMLDLDGDGDLDVVTCEEVHNLGVFWYENPTR